MTETREKKPSQDHGASEESLPHAAPIDTQATGMNRLRPNVIFPTGNEQIYHPMFEYGTNEKKFNELEVIQNIVACDQETKGKNVTTVMIQSPPGLGKTVLGTFLARKYQCPYVIVNCVSTVTDLDLLGNMVLIQGNTVWQDGPLPSIIRAANTHGMGILILNELNALSLNAQVALNPLLDRQQCVILTLNNNEVVKMEGHAHLLIITTMNPDIMGVNDVQDAVQDRADIVLKFDYLSPEKEARLVSEITSIPFNVAFQMAEVISECRLLKTRDHKIQKAPSTRGFLSWIYYARRVGIETAFILTIVNKYGTSEAEADALRMMAKGKSFENIKISEFVKNTSVAQDASAPNSKAASVAKIFETSWQQRALIMHELGYSNTSIAKSLSVTKERIYRFLRRHEDDSN